eukprot:CAMPEP_0202109086 /NCGR_PEP_ID=MMETSP0965-20130614/22899_1 /ASSEMBLY_ACC=CAM_ASM_000507 /TAXON_ID=4773 /ORGANISM="Schizochytrium aggregatum, Strain ATCC28209" /LENGTH=128 /DNA_ID=CAMNT_0048678399 /DNA_START=279 /DNA_END=666 /DNA_ORIENTATION=-
MLGAHIEFRARDTLALAQHGGVAVVALLYHSGACAFSPSQYTPLNAEHAVPQVVRWRRGAAHLRQRMPSMPPVRTLARSCLPSPGRHCAVASICAAAAAVLVAVAAVAAAKLPADSSATRGTAFPHVV